jgi:hypothetical protein
VDSKGKATPSGARKWLVGFDFLAIRSDPPDGGRGIFFNEFKAPTAIHRRWRLNLTMTALARAGRTAASPSRLARSAPALTGCRRPGGGLPSDQGSK